MTQWKQQRNNIFFCECIVECKRYFFSKNESTQMKLVYYNNSEIKKIIKNTFLIFWWSKIKRNLILTGKYLCTCCTTTLLIITKNYYLKNPHWLSSWQVKNKINSSRMKYSNKKTVSLPYSCLLVFAVILTETKRKTKIMWLL